MRRADGDRVEMTADPRELMLPLLHSNTTVSRVARVYRKLGIHTRPEPGAKLGSRD